MSTLTTSWVAVGSLYVGAQITYDRREWIVLEVLEMPIGGWVVIALAVADLSERPQRCALVYANRVATAELSHRALEVAHAS